jgi:membrane carboxypeptidase/penicillin-binding protein
MTSGYQGSSFQKKKLTSSMKFPSFSRWLLITCLSAPLLIASIWLYINVFKDLPNIKSIEEKGFKQATTITARDGEVLYKLYEENREYIPFE